MGADDCGVEVWGGSVGRGGIQRSSVARFVFYCVCVFSLRCFKGPSFYEIYFKALTASFSGRHTEIWNYINLSK